MSQYHPSIFILVHHFFHHHPVHVGAVLLVGVPGHLVPGQENWAPWLMVWNPTHPQKTLMNHEIMRSDHDYLVVLTHLKNISQIGSFHQVGLKPPPRWGGPDRRTVLKFHFRQRWRHATHLPALQFFLHNSWHCKPGIAWKTWNQMTREGSNKTMHVYFMFMHVSSFSRAWAKQLTANPKVLWRESLCAPHSIVSFAQCALLPSKIVVKEWEACLTSRWARQNQQSFRKNSKEFCRSYEICVK